MINVNESNFNEETSTGVVVVDFYADWCGPCKLLGPVLEKITDAKVVKVNIDDNQNLAAEHKVSAIPKLLFMKDGKVLDQMMGLSTQKAIQDKVNALKGA